MSAKQSIIPSHFYAIADSSFGDEPVGLVGALLTGGAKIIQIRIKDLPTGRLLETACRAVALCHQYGATVLINDRADVALLAGADGVHLGQQDLPLQEARELLGPDRIIGVSTASLEQALSAEAEGADYIGFGPLYAGGLKQNLVGKGLDALRKVRAAVKIPVVAIGGITESNASDALAAGADAVAIITAVLKSSDIPAKVQHLLALR